MLSLRELDMFCECDQFNGSTALERASDLVMPDSDPALPRVLEREINPPTNISSS